VPAGVALLLERRAGLAGGAGAGSRERVLRAFRLRPVADRAIGDRERLGDGDLGSERDILARCRVAHTVISGDEPPRPRDMDPESEPEQRVTREPRRDSLRRHGRRTWLYTWAGALVALLVILIALVVANTARVKVSWVLGSTHQSLVWIILVTAILGWLLGIVTSVILRFRTRRRNSTR